MIRRIREEEVDRILELLQAAFAISFPPEELEWRRKTLVPEQFLGYFADGALCAQVGVLPLAVYIDGAPYQMGGIASVASYPEMRRRGMVGSLLTESLRAMREAGQTVSLLNPFSYAFYRKYGWEQLAEVRDYSFDIAPLDDRRPFGGAVRRLARPEWPLLKGVYDAYARRYNGMLARDDHAWEHVTLRRKQGNIALYCDGAGKPAGYMVYKVGDGVFRIGEWAALDEDARSGLLRFAANHSSVARTVTVRAPADDDLAFRLPEPTIRQEMTPAFMARIVDVAAFMREYLRGRAAPGESVVIRITDENAEWNAGVWTFAWHDDGSVSAVNAGLSAPAPLACDIRTFAAMTVGARRPRRLFETGRLTGDAAAAERWERLLPNRTAYIADFF